MLPKCSGTQRKIKLEKQTDQSNENTYLICQRNTKKRFFFLIFYLQLNLNPIISKQ